MSMTRKLMKENDELLAGKNDVQSRVLWNLSQAILEIAKDLESIDYKVSSIESKVQSIKSNL